MRGAPQLFLLESLDDQLCFLAWAPISSSIIEWRSRGVLARTVLFLGCVISTFFIAFPLQLQAFLDLVTRIDHKTFDSRSYHVFHGIGKRLKGSHNAFRLSR